MSKKNMKKHGEKNCLCPAAPQFVKGDIQSLDLVLHLLASEEVDTVMHFAAQVLFFGNRSCCTASCPANMAACRACVLQAFLPAVHVRGRHDVHGRRECMQPSYRAYPTKLLIAHEAQAASGCCGLICFLTK